MLGLPLLLAAGAVVLARTVDHDGVAPAPQADAPLAVAAVPAPAADSPQCAALLAALPDRLQSGSTQLDRRPLAEPVPPGTAAWGAQRPAVLRCGLDRPAELTRTAALLQINGVRWLQLRDQAAEVTSWVAVDRAVYVVLTLADPTGTGPLQDVSSAITATLPAQPVQPGG